MASLKFLRVLGNHLKNSTGNKGRDIQNINLNKIQQHPSELQLTRFDTDYLKMTNMYMNYQDELDQYYNVNSPTLPETQAQQDEKAEKRLTGSEKKAMEKVGLDLELLSEKNEDSCSVSQTLQSLNDDESSIQIPSNKSNKEKDDDKKHWEQPINDATD